jgi:hypothetical protein
MLGPDILGPRTRASAAAEVDAVYPESDADSDDEDSDGSGDSDDSEGVRETRAATARTAASAGTKKKKSLALAPLNCQRTALVTASGFRYLVEHRANMKRFKAILVDLKLAIKALRTESQYVRPVSAPAASSSSSSSTSSAAAAAAAASSSSSSSAAAAAAAASSSSSSSAAAAASAPLLQKPRPTSAPALRKDGGAKRKKLKSNCEDTNCGSNSDDLIQCNLCYTTFCSACWTEEYKTRHQEGRLCLASRGLKIV